MSLPDQTQLTDRTVMIGNEKVHSYLSGQIAKENINLFDVTEIPIRGLARFGLFGVKQIEYAEYESGPPSGDFDGQYLLVHSMSNHESGKVNNDHTTIDPDKISLLRMWKDGAWVDPEPINGIQSNIARGCTLDVSLLPAAWSGWDCETGGYNIGDWVKSEKTGRYYRSMTDNNHVNPDTVDLSDEAANWEFGLTKDELCELGRARYRSILDAVIAWMIDEGKLDDTDGVLPPDAIIEVFKNVPNGTWSQTPDTITYTDDSDTYEWVTKAKYDADILELQNAINNSGSTIDGSSITINADGERQVDEAWLNSKIEEYLANIPSCGGTP